MSQRDESAQRWWCSLSLFSNTLFSWSQFSSDADKCHSGSVAVTTGGWNMCLTEKTLKWPSRIDKHGNRCSRADLFTLLNHRCNYIVYFYCQDTIYMERNFIFCSWSTTSPLFVSRNNLVYFFYLKWCELVRIRPGSIFLRILVGVIQ